MTTTYLSPVALAFMLHISTNAGVFKKTIKCLNAPTLSYVVNSTGQSITLDFPAANNAPLITQGDIIKITEDGGDGSVLYTGIVEDLPDSIDQTVDHQITLTPLGVELADADFTQDYSVATDVATMIRDAVARTVHCTATITTVPPTGILRIFNFNEKSPLYVLNAAIKMAGTNYVWYVDEIGQVFFGPSSNTIYSVKTRVDASVRKYTAPITNQKNYIKAFGGILPNTTTKISAVYDQTGSSAIGRRALMPPLQFPNLTDQTTLNSIVNTIGNALNQPQITVVLELPNAGQRINLARVGGASIRYFEPDKDDLGETSPGSGTYSPFYVIVQVDVTGPVQRVTARGVAFSVDDFVNEINENLSRVSTDASNLPLTPGQVVGATTGGPSTPSVVAWATSFWTTGIENIAQVNNAYIIVKWTPNNGNENISRYEIRYSKSADGNYFTESALAGVVDGGGRGFIKIAGLLQGVDYWFSIRAINYLGIPGTWNSTQVQVAASDSTAPATPASLVAIRTPRGALVRWAGNTETDLKGYEVQVSVAGGAYTSIDAGLHTSLAYTAPSGTTTGTTLVFQVRAIDWSGNISAWSGTSSATTDGVGFDELLVGNLSVFGTLTTGGFQTAPSGARFIIDSTSIRASDGGVTNWGAPSGAGITAEIKNDGTAFFKGAIRSSTVYASEIATSAAHASSNPPSSAGSGFKLKDQFLDLFTVGTITEGTRYWYAPDSVSPFTLAGILAAGTMKFARGSADSNTEIITTSGGPVIASAMAIASFKPSTTIALRGVKGAFTSTLGGSVQPPFGQATASGNLLVAWVAANTATPPSIATATSGWVRAVVANATNAEATIWYKLNCGAGETAPTFTATLQAPGGGVTDTATSIINTSPGLNPNANNMSIASFSPAVAGTPITLRSLGALQTGTNASVSPAFGVATASGDLLVAWVSGSDHTPGTAGLTIGPSDAATFGFNHSGVNSDNIIFTGNYSMPTGGGYITKISIYMGGYSASVDCYFCIWDSSTGGVLARSAYTNIGIGLGLRELSIANTFISGGTTLVVGFYRNKAQDAQWGVQGTGTFGFVTNKNDETSIVGAATCSLPYLCGALQSYATFTAWTATAAITTGTAGWVKAVDAANGDEETQLWYKPNCGASETAPVFTSANGGSPLHAQLAEFTGAKTSSVLDKTGTFLQTTTSATMIAANSVADTQAGDLILYASRWSLVSTGTATWTDSLNTTVSQAAGNTGASSLTRHSDFAYGIVSVPAMHAQVAEFTGALTAAALDQTGTANQTNANTGLSVSASSIDVSSNDLVLTTGRWVQSVNGTASWLDTYNNATSVSAGNSGSLNTDQHSNFAYGIISTSPTGTVLQITNFVGLEAVTTGTSLGRGLIATQYSTDAASANFSARKARGSQVSPTSVSNGDMIAAYFASAYDGTNWYNVGRITFDVNGAVSAGNIPTDMNVRLNPGSGEYVHMALQYAGGAKNTYIAGAFYAPFQTTSPYYAGSSYGTIPVKIEEQLLGAATGTITFINPLPTGFRHLWIEWHARSDVAAVNANILLRLNNISTATYEWQQYYASAAANNPSEGLNQTSVQIGIIPGATATANYFGVGQAKVYHYQGTVANKLIESSGIWAQGDATTTMGRFIAGGKWRTTGTAVTRLDLILSAGQFVVGSLFTLWGIP